MSLRLADPEQTAAALDTALPADGGLVLFEGTPVTETVAACDALARRRGLRLNRIDADALAGGDVLAVQGNLREAFDEMRSPAVFVLTNADALLDAPVLADDDPEARSPGEQLALYLFDRIEAFDGIVALALRRLPAPFEDRRVGALVVTA
jgi:hypothetical protein